MKKQSKPKPKPIGDAASNQNHKRVVPAVVTCACNRDITLDELADTYLERGIDKLEKFLPHLNAAMSTYDIKSCLRKAHFLAQAGHESAELQYTAEVLGKNETEQKKYGGYKGRGLIQLTFKQNYVKYGKAINQDLLGDNRTKVEEPKLATDSAGWYWSAGTGETLNKYADQNDLIFISAAVNGGFNGYEGEAASRLKLLKNAVKGLNVKVCPQLEGLFAAFPEMEKFDYNSFKFEKSRAYDKASMSYAWGSWHDPDSKRKGTRKDAEQAKIGYKRFLELAPKPKKKGLLDKLKKKTKMEEKIEHAEKRLKEIK